MKQKLLFITLCTLHLFTLAQTPVFYNNGATVTVTSGATVKVNGNLSNNTGSLTNVGTLQIAGAINNSGTLTSTAGTIEMIGSTAQTIPANTFSGNTLLNLKISNTSVTSAGALNITGAISFGNVNNSSFNTSGLLTLKSTDITTARVADVTNGNTNFGNGITGNVTVQRFLPQGKRAYRQLASGVNTTNNIRSNWQNSGVNTPAKGIHITGSSTGANGFDATQTGNPSVFTYTREFSYLYSHARYRWCQYFKSFARLQCFCNWRPQCRPYHHK